MEKTWNNKAWFMVIPVLVLVAFSAVILALITASITYTVLTWRRRWYVRDLDAIAAQRTEAA